ncbi:type II secretion system protein GspD [Cyanobium sp. ATX 6A2]|uniref:type II secretion system protein GspD n=1 Tax=Cyanobium sp. ATX 6A2 TaxID=2823700 RepID=UPI0020CFA3C0|nr:general secretion pathway protein D [Cyanobium sp. ATX 6A2]
MGVPVEAKSPEPTEPAAAPAEDLLAQASRAGTNELQLRARRFPDAVELVIEGAGSSPQLQQSGTASRWQGRLSVPSASGLRNGPQRLSMPELGFQSVSFDGSDGNFMLSVEASPGINLGRPVVSSDGRDLILTFASPVPQARLQVNRANLSQPGAVPLPTYAPPLQPRAVAPPLGDMAVGTMTMRSPGFLNVSGPPVTMTLKNAPARDALMALAQLGGYGFAYVDNTTSDPAASAGARPISVAFRNESYSNAMNTTLLSAGLQGKREGNVIFAGPNALGSGIGAQVSKVYRLNQVGPNAAADYLANLGATITKTDTIITSVTSGVAESDLVARSLASQTTQSQAVTQVREFGAARGPLVGLRATTDTRLGTITMVGSPDIIAIGEHYLKQLDLRQRQVALSLKILDVDLGNDTEIDNSFAIRWGDTFIVNDRGSLLGAFGRALPPTFRPGAAEVNPGLGFSPPAANPGLAYPENEFFNFLRAQIVSRNTKLLASPTLILQENASLLRSGTEGSVQDIDDDVRQGIRDIGIDSPIGRRRANEGVVRVGTNVVTNYETNETQGVISCTPELSTAGLVLGARVEKIDDNGFVTFTLSPSISAVVDQEPAPSGCGAPLNILSIRSLDTGALRVRDGQTLILTGVISDFTRSEVSKWPILGDIPLIGQFFRATVNQREKRELVILVSPRIINDDDGGMFGYGFQPSANTVRSLLGAPGPDQGF